VVVPTLAAGDALKDCLRSLQGQKFRDFEVIVIDNSGCRRAEAVSSGVKLIANERNVGFGEALNQGFRASTAAYIAALNDDAVADINWLARLVADADSHPQAGMFASEVRLQGTGNLDSCGMLIAADGTSKQRGHAESPEHYANLAEALFPSGSAALYRTKMLDQIGFFDATYFLYCEDTDLGLRARWAGWECRYVPGAIVEHAYSQSAGRASLLKAYHVERNRLYTVFKNFPLAMLMRAPFAAVARYFWHLASILDGRGKASEFQGAGQSPLWLVFVVLRAHAAALVRLPRLLKQRRAIFRSRTITTPQFRELLAKHSISLRKVAAL
jgi:GT2 family glycosyltransferase